jgi:hypothetical protein
MAPLLKVIEAPEEGSTQVPLRAGSITPLVGVEAQAAIKKAITSASNPNRKVLLFILFSFRSFVSCLLIEETRSLRSVAKQKKRPATLHQEGSGDAGRG